MGRTKIQRLLNKVDKINCDRECDTNEFAEALAALGREVYCKSLKEDVSVIELKNPRKDRE